MRVSLLFAYFVLLGVFSLPALAATLSESSMRTLTYFDHRSGEPGWVAVNDGVMGGRSDGRALVSDGQLLFTGDLSLENNGGFASVRSVGVDFDLTGVTAVVLRVRGDGRPYQLRLATGARYRGIAVSFGAEFGTRAGEWIEVRVPLKSLTATVRGSVLDDAVLDPSQVREIGLLIADKREGGFALAVDWIAVVSDNGKDFG